MFRSPLATASPLSEQQVTADSLRGQAEQRGRVNPMGREAERVAVQTWRTYLHAALLLQAQAATRRSLVMLYIDTWLEPPNRG